MRTTLKRLGAGAAAATMALTLAACSAQDETVVAFCDARDSIETLQGESTDVESESDAADRLEQVTAAMEAVEAPEEIADSFTLVTESFRAMSDATAKILVDPEDQDDVIAASAAMQSDEFQQATTELDTFTEENCS